ncbi:MAG TPA: hypothetical protein VFI34_01630 [Candidatus Limnocylindrales bacterium]|nr:hypothetical protein [Candidatus Limnocylindrales bacterium]
MGSPGGRPADLRHGSPRALTSSEEQEGAPARITPVAERAEDAPRIAVEPGKRVRGGLDGSTIASRLRDHENHAIGVSIADLEADLSLERLHVVHDGFRLERPPPHWRAKHCVPGPPIPIVGQRDLEGDVDRRVKPEAEAPDEALLAGVSDGVASQVGLHAHIPSEDRTDRTQLDQGWRTLASDDSGNGPAGHPARASDHFVTEPSHPLGPGDLLHDPPLIVGRDADRSVDLNTSPGHGVRVTIGAARPVR